MLALTVNYYCVNTNQQFIVDTKYEYMYTFKYPAKKAPDGGYKAYAKTMKKKVYAYEFDVTVMGIRQDNPFFDVKLSNGINEVSISSSVAIKYSLGVGDNITLEDEEFDRYYAFKVKGVTQYSPSLLVFVPNVSTGVDTAFPVRIYPGIFVGVMIIYTVVNDLLVRRIKKMVPAEVLRNRE